MSYSFGVAEKRPSRRPHGCGRRASESWGYGPLPRDRLCIMPGLYAERAFFRDAVTPREAQRGGSYLAQEQYATVALEREFGFDASAQHEARVLQATALGLGDAPALQHGDAARRNQGQQQLGDGRYARKRAGRSAREALAQAVVVAGFLRAPLDYPSAQVERG